MSERILVTGGHGFIGSNVVPVLQGAGHPVTVLDRTAPRFGETPGERWVRGDFGNAGALEEALDGVGVVVHLVCTSLPKTSNDDPRHDVRTNVVDTLSLLDAALARKVRKVVFLSSGGTVYGIPRTVPLSEDHPTEPTCSYGITRLMTEKYLHLYQLLHGLSYAILRVSNPFGPHQRIDGIQGAVAVFLGKAMRGEPVEIWGDGSVVRDFLYVEDLAAAVLRAVHHPDPGVLVNVGSGRGTSLEELVGLIGKVMGGGVDVVRKPGRAFDVPSNVLDIGRAESILGWQPTTSMEEGLRRTVEWWRRRGSEVLQPA